jgi:hypothetical protein
MESKRNSLAFCSPPIWQPYPYTGLSVAVVKPQKFT